MRRILIVAGVLVALVGVVAIVGIPLPSSHVVSRSIVLRQPRDSVWAVVTDFASQPSWRKDVTRVERLSVGADVEIWREDGAEPLLLQTTESVAPRRLVRTIADPTLPFGGRWIYEFEPTPSGGTRVTVTEEGEVYNPIFRVVSRFMDPSATIRAYLTNLAARFGEQVAIQ